MQENSIVTTWLKISGRDELAIIWDKFAVPIDLIGHRAYKNKYLE